MSEIEVSHSCRSCNEPVFDSAKFCSACGVTDPTIANESRIKVAKEFASGSLKQAESSGRELLKNKTAQKIAGGALLGAGAATVIPFLTMGVGATLGAAYVAYKHLTKD